MVNDIFCDVSYKKKCTDSLQQANRLSEKRRLEVHRHYNTIEISE
jgi:hypothetical protein